MKRLLITGATGFLGWNLCQVAQATGQVYGTYHAHSVALPNIPFYFLNLSNYSDIKQLFAEIKPDAVCHLAARSQPNDCQTHPTETEQVNVIGTRYIAQLCADLDISLVFTSTDLVFDGQNAPYHEQDAVNPVNRYGEQKVKAEQEIQRIYPKAVICRMPLMFGLPSPVSQSFMQGFLKSLQAGQELSLFSDEYRTPVSATAAAQGLLLALRHCQGEILHLGGKERISRYEFGVYLVKTFKISRSQLKACRQEDVKMAAPRPADVSLNSHKAFALGYQPLFLETELEKLAQSYRKLL